jgi:hypothetical protein
MNLITFGSKKDHELKQLMKEEGKGTVVLE